MGNCVALELGLADEYDDNEEVLNISEIFGNIIYMKNSLKRQYYNKRSECENNKNMRENYEEFRLMPEKEEINQINQNIENIENNSSKNINDDKSILSGSSFSFENFQLAESIYLYRENESE